MRDRRLGRAVERSDNVVDAHLALLLESLQDFLSRGITQSAAKRDAIRPDLCDARAHVN